MGKLFPHNQETYDRVLSLFNEVNKVAVIQATGTGKGFLASEFIHVAFKGKNILVLVPNDAIKENYEKAVKPTASAISWHPQQESNL